MLPQNILDGETTGFALSPHARFPERLVYIRCPGVIDIIAIQNLHIAFAIAYRTIPIDILRQVGAG